MEYIKKYTGKIYCFIKKLASKKTTKENRTPMKKWGSIGAMTEVGPKIPQKMSSSIALF